MATGVALAACGPSFQAVYEGNARFEHCYALEENAQKPMPDKAACWRDWSEHYTYGQTRDRIQYATARYVALSQAPALPTDEALMMAAPGEVPRVMTITAPAPTNAFAPPPKTLDPNEAKPSRPPSDVAGVPTVPEPKPVPQAAPLPASGCADTCSGKFRECSGTCDGDAVKKSRACQTCQGTYRTCMRACFK